MALSQTRKRKPATKRSALTILRSPAMDSLPWLVHGFSTRPGGASKAYGKAGLNLGFTAADKRAGVERNRALLLKTLDPKGKWKLVTQRQVHSDVVRNVARASAEPQPGDALLTSTSGLMLAVLTADCLPILLADKKHRAIAAVHAGWRGTVQRIAEKAVGAMRRDFGSAPEDLVAAIGPGIHRCCYSVGDEVGDQFESQFPYAADLFEKVFDSDPIKRKYPMLFLTARAPGHSNLGPELHLDLVEANRRQLLAAGLKEVNIWASPLCTACNLEQLFSHRAEHGHTGRQMGVIGIRA